MTSVKEILALMRDTSEEGQNLVRNAYAFSKKAHEGLTRYSGEPYFIHPAATAKILAEFGMDSATIASGLLHDSIEDACATTEEIKEQFGAEVLFIVEGVTKLGKHKYRGSERHAESLRRLLVATASDLRVLIVKLADRYHNMQTLEYVPETKRRRIALETLEIYTPLADRLGMGRLKRELQDLAFPYVDHDAYVHTIELRQLKTKETEVGLKKVQKMLQLELVKKESTKFRTDLRMKGLWSLHQKLRRKKDDITLVHDIAALRIILDSVSDCYITLGIIHSLFKPLPGEFKDYIAFPKPNGYQSLHTTVLTKEAGIVEIQIRTEDMHRRAQFGVASHLAYKQLGKEASILAEHKKSFSQLSFTWVRNLIPSLLKLNRPNTKYSGAPNIMPYWLSEVTDAHADIAGSKEFVAGLREDFFSHRVFVFTPDGDVIDLPSGATPIDFAYAIHSDLGNHLQGAKVNGKLVSFETALGNGDVVEVIHRDSARPSVKWLDSIKTSLARKQIKIALGMTEPEKKPERRKAVRLPKRRHAK